MVASLAVGGKRRHILVLPETTRALVPLGVCLQMRKASLAIHGIHHGTASHPVSHPPLQGCPSSVWPQPLDPLTPRCRNETQKEAEPSNGESDSPSNTDRGVISGASQIRPVGARYLFSAHRNCPDCLPGEPEAPARCHRNTVELILSQRRGRWRGR